eukprot:SM000361S13807  [mRNA]  locus=s361:11596:16571:- [translate_table: standard]
MARGLKEPAIRSRRMQSPQLEPRVAELRSSHAKLLARCGPPGQDRPRKLYSYSHAINGFAAVLSAGQAAVLAGMPEVAVVAEDRMLQMQTTRSWSFLGLDSRSPPLGLWNRTDGRDVVVGILDTGKESLHRCRSVWPEHPSFWNQSLGAVPVHFKGNCKETGATFASRLCNQKLVGAQYFYEGFVMNSGVDLIGSGETLSPRDVAGHGTHVASTALGAACPGANIGGNVFGTSKGMAFGARLSMYKVCWAPDPSTTTDGNCASSDIFMGLDQAIRDGVDVISMSLSGGNEAFLGDFIAEGALNAVLSGIPVVAAAGNAGPDPRTVANVAPWLITVGASTIDRTFQNAVVLGNGVSVLGVSLTGGTLPAKQFYPLVQSSSIAIKGATIADANLCLNGTLDPRKAVGTIVMCTRGVNGRVEKAAIVQAAGGVGTILREDFNGSESGLADLKPIPSTHVGVTAGRRIIQYILSSRNPTAYITATEQRLGQRSPQIADFSAAGPSSLTDDLLKPDIVAPGVSILASGFGQGTQFKIMSGTSMATPHVSGVLALLKSMHPTWSPAALKSAIMTTATVLDNTGQRIVGVADGKPASPLQMGAGHIDADKAANPGLVYDAGELDYIAFLCSYGYPTHLISSYFSMGCPSPGTRIADLNYPTFQISHLSAPTRVTRVVTNVGDRNSLYSVTV